MKKVYTLGRLAVLLFGCLSGQSVFAQTKADVVNDASMEITWLGLDFSQARFIGAALQFKDAGEVSNDDFQHKYIPGWNQLFIDEPKKFKVAEMVHRPQVNYATDITQKANAELKKDFFSNNATDFKKIDEKKIAELVGNYDFQGKTGVGLLFFVEGMSKAQDQGAAWVTLVNMQTKKVIWTSYKTAKPGGFGFRNYWAGCWYNILKDLKSDFKK